MKFLKLILIIPLIFLLTGCNMEKGIILFNKEPISRQNLVNDAKTFKIGQKVYYIFISQKKIDSEFIRVQIFKMTDLAPWGGNDVLRTKDVRLMKNEGYYHTDYFIFHEKGRYVMQVFSHNDFTRPLAVNDFFVTE